MMFRRELVHLVPRQQRPMTGDRTLSHDTWIYTLAAALGKVSHLASSYILYRQHGGNVTVVDSRRWLRRLTDLATFPVQHYRQIMKFDREIADILAHIAPGHPHWSEALEIAAERYRQRASRIHDRLLTYQRPSIAERLDAFVAAHRTSYRSRTAAGSSAKIVIKDLIVGVLRLGKIV
jgi:hypothetical protein